MSRNVTIDLTECFRGSTPALRRKLGDFGGLASLNRRFRDAPWSLDLPTAEQVAASAAYLSGGGKGRPAFGGQPGALAGARLWVKALGLDLALLSPEDALPPATAALVVQLGTPAIEALVDRAVERGIRVAVACASDNGQPVAPPDGGVWVDDPWGAEGGRGALGSGVLVACALAGLDVSGALSGARWMFQASDGPVAESVCWSLARALRLLSVEGGRDAIIHIAGGAPLFALAAWAASTQAESLAGISLHSPTRPLPAVVLAGDVGWKGAITSAPRERVALVWESAMGEDGAHWIAALVDAGVPVIRVRLPSRDAETVGACVALWLRALECLAAMEERGGESAGQLRSGVRSG